MAFQGEEISAHPELEPIGKKILRKCGNVPLAIVIVGSLLAQKNIRDERTWTEFYDNKLKQVFSSRDDNSVKQVLMVSYNDLHPNLKLCFTTCSLFPKDYRFDKDELVRLWIAQGILKPSDDNEQSLEEVGEAYFFQLVDRCLFQELREYNKYCTVKIHDLLHDMAIDVAKTENLFLDKVPENKLEIDGLRQISINFDIKDPFDCFSLVSDPKTVRTLLFNHNQGFCLSFFKPLLESFTMLRTLCLYHLEIDGIPESIGGLIHLRYLNLSSNRKLKHLPESICKLHHLMILALKYCTSLEKLPQRIEKLVSLRQLLIDECSDMNSLPSGLKSLTSLLNLDRLIVHHRDGGLGYLKDLDNLAGVLKIELPQEGWLDAIEDAKNANMVRKNKLKEMVIEWKERSTTMGEAKEVLEALQPHEKLKYLSIMNYGGEMLSSWFWTLRYVKQLCLCYCDNVEYLEDGIKGNLDLPSLQLLKISSMGNLKGWRRQEMAQGTSRLQLSTVFSLTIKECPKLKGQMPLFEAIENLKLSRVDAEVVEELLVPNSSSQSSFSPFHNNSKLTYLKLHNIPSLTQLPEGWIRHLNALQELTVNDCEDLKRVSCRGLSHLTALKHLSVESGEIGTEEDDKIGSEAGMPWKALQGLDELVIGVGDINLVEGLQYLTSLRHLWIMKWKDVFIGEGEMNEVELPIKALQNLHGLSMGFGNGTFHLPKSRILHIRSLNYLKIADCKDLYLSWKTLLGMKLARLVFERVKRVIDVEDDTMTALGQQSLIRSLDIKKVAGGKWVDDLPWISLSLSLKELNLWGMGEREQLPDGIQHLTSLQFLAIEECEKLRSLPVWIPKLTSLYSLTIGDCSAELKRRCERGTGEDWPLIRHVPHTSIYASMSSNQVESANESSNEEEANRKRGCTPCWRTSV